MQSFDFLFGVSLNWIRNSTLHRKSQPNRAEEGPVSCRKPTHYRISLTTLSEMRNEDSSILEITKQQTRWFGRQWTKTPSTQEDAKATWNRERSSRVCNIRKRTTQADVLWCFRSCGELCEGLKEHFDQQGYCVYRHLADVLLKSVRVDKTFEEDLDFILDFYKDDLDKTSLSIITTRDFHTVR